MPWTTAIRLHAGASLGTERVTKSLEERAPQENGSFSRTLGTGEVGATLFLYEKGSLRVGLRADGEARTFQSLGKTAWQYNPLVGGTVEFKQASVSLQGIRYYQDDGLLRWRFRAEGGFQVWDNLMLTVAVATGRREIYYQEVYDYQICQETDGRLGNCVGGKETNVWDGSNRTVDITLGIKTFWDFPQRSVR